MKHISIIVDQKEEEKYKDKHEVEEALEFKRRLSGI